jgi:hypothetical protein
VTTGSRRFALIFAFLVLLPAAFGASANAAKKTVRLAVCQILVIDSDREGNFRRIEYALDQAEAQGAQIAVFPESSILGWENPEAHRLAAPIPGADSDRIAALARKHKIMIAIGLDEKDGDKLYDSAILVDKSGKLLWKHRKINVLAELMTPPYSEGKPEGIGVVETEFGRIASRTAQVPDGRRGPGGRDDARAMGRLDIRRIELCGRCGRKDSVDSARPGYGFTGDRACSGITGEVSWWSSIAFCSFSSQFRTGKLSVLFSNPYRK